MNFNIRQKSNMPYLVLEFVKNIGTDDTFFDNLKNAKIYFQMLEPNTCNGFTTCGLCELCEQKKCDNCEPNLLITYKWKKEDTQNKGHFKGRIKIIFNESLETYLLPIGYDLNIIIE
jgi:hypothetical protein